MIAKLHYITQPVEGKTIEELIEATCQGGTNWVQTRIKNKSYADWKSEAEKVQTICKKYNALHIINDNVQLAKEIGADGIHLGKQDMNPIEARKIIGNNAIIGGTANDFEDILRLAKANVDYIGLGPLRFTNTKEKLSPILGLEGYQDIFKKCLKNNIEIPIIAIGGIRLEDVSSLIELGCHGIALSSAINLDSNPTKTTEQFLNHLSLCH